MKVRSFYVAGTRGAYLACSWTWCIGMFFPILLLMDFGWPAFFVFAVPNVAGVMLFGWVMKRDGAAASLTERHSRAAAMFSLVTLAFHAFFIAWVVGMWVNLAALGPWAQPLADPANVAMSLGNTRELGETVKFLRLAGFTLWQSPALIGLVGGLLVYFVGLLASVSSLRVWFGVSALVWAISVGLLALAMPWDGLTTGEWTLDVASLSGPAELLWAAPAIAFGFLLCPYLDLTFLRVRRESPGAGGDGAFAVGFPLFFTVMIVGTLTYAPGVLMDLRIAALALLHIMMQSAFTIGAHLRELRELRQTLPAASSGFVRLAPVAATLLPMVFAEMWGGGELTYRFFMSAYGLVFPAFVWIMVMPRATGGEVSGRRKLVGFMLAVGIAAPFFGLGFLGRQWWLLAPGVGVVLVAPLVLRVVRGASPKGSLEARAREA